MLLGSYWDRVVLSCCAGALYRVMTRALLPERSLHIERRKAEELAVGRAPVLTADLDGGALLSFHGSRPRVA